ncbi:IclR family transcriptional regulator [Burkholderia ubonensis]|uniref:IclR family transcriptional regulator n=1 Tax=Burkholderia ubonensis TaxID=101571 RepID=UPI00075881E1|nr:IclR family transcriptional regulator [Burkholderia ubonensis]KVC73354.1 IclR family transcriptional regulator [Burkholderia ubonensis]
MNYIVEAVDSALKLLNCVAEHPHLGVTRLALKLGINKSRAYRMLCTLEIHRFVVQDERTSTYALGTQAFVIGVAALRQTALVHAAQCHMLALSQAINETVVLRVRDGLETVCIMRCETTREIRTIGAVGNRRPVSLGASGKVLLAFAPSEVRDTYFAKVRRTGQGDPFKLAEELDAVARKGYAVSVGEVTAGVVAVAVPICDRAGTAIASLSVTGPEVRISRVNVHDYLARLQACSNAIAVELGRLSTSAVT